MQELPRRTSFSGPALVRLLARFNNADISEPGQSLSDRLSQWLGWSDAISLAAVLNGAQLATAGTDAARLDAANEYGLVRAALTEAIAAINAPASPTPRRRRPGASPEVSPPAPVEFPDYRRRYIALQQTMETRIADLRARLRTALASRSGPMAGLAALDAAMEQALGEREYQLLARLPALLETHFHRLRRADAAIPASASDPALSEPKDAQAWQNIFHQDMQSVLFAELDIRLQPAQALLAALDAR